MDVLKRLINPASVVYRIRGEKVSQINKYFLGTYLFGLLAYKVIIDAGRSGYGAENYLRAYTIDLMATRPLPIYPTDRDLYVALSRREERAYQFLYAESFPSFRHWMLANSGSEMDAEDAFQKGLLSLLLNIETGKYQFQEGTRVTTVVFEYCKRVWLTELKSARLRTSVAMPDGFDAIDTTDVANDLDTIGCGKRRDGSHYSG